MGHMRPSVLAAATLCLSLIPVLRAQEAPSPGGPPPASEAAPQPLAGLATETLKVNVNPLNVYFSVRQRWLHHQPQKGRLQHLRGQGPPEDQELHPGKEPPANHRSPLRHQRKPAECPSVRAGSRI